MCIGVCSFSFRSLVSVFISSVAAILRHIVCLSSLSGFSNAQIVFALYSLHSLLHYVLYALRAYFFALLFIQQFAFWRCDGDEISVRYWTTLHITSHPNANNISVHRYIPSNCVVDHFVDNHHSGKPDFQSHIRKYSFVTIYTARLFEAQDSDTHTRGEKVEHLFRASQKWWEMVRKHV